jgi:hypothetical protein
VESEGVKEGESACFRMSENSIQLDFISIQGSRFRLTNHSTKAEWLFPQDRMAKERPLQSSGGLIQVSATSRPHRYLLRTYLFRKVLMSSNNRLIPARTV